MAINVPAIRFPAGRGSSAAGGSSINVFYDAATRAQQFKQNREKAERGEEVRNIFAETMRNRDQYGSEQEALTGAAQKMGAAGGIEEYAKIMGAVKEMDESERKTLKDMSERHGASALFLLDQFNDNVKAMKDPVKAFEPVRQEYAKLYNSLSVKDRKYMTAPDQITPPGLAGMAHEASVTRMLLGQYKAEEAAKKAKSKGDLTLTQQSRNEEIDQAREELSKMGLTKSDIQKKTKQFSATGRMNTDYDPQISKVVALATRRKVGMDQDYETFYSNLMGAGGEKKAGARTGRKAKSKAGTVYYEMSDGSWIDDKGNPFKGK